MCGPYAQNERRSVILEGMAIEGKRRKVRLKTNYTEKIIKDAKADP